MKKFFEILQDDKFWRQTCNINASHRWGLPGVTCPSCKQTWIVVGESYPTIDLSNHPDVHLFTAQYPVDVDELQRRQNIIAPLLPQKLNRLRPAMDLGPLVGTAQGDFGDFAWVGLWTLLIKHDALEKLLEAGVKVPKAAPTQLTFRKKNPPLLLELEIEPAVKIHNVRQGKASDKCIKCGREEIRRPPVIEIEASSFPSEVDIARGEDLTTAIFVSERFANAVTKLKLSNAVFREVKTHD